MAAPFATPLAARLASRVPRLATRLGGLALRIDAMTLRERGILLAVSLLVLYAVGDRLLLAPNLQRLAQSRTEISELQSRLAALQARAQLIQQNGQDPLAPQRAHIRDLETRLAAQDAQFESQLGKLVRPEQAEPLLREVLQETPGLHLQKLESAGGEPVLAAGDHLSRVIRYNLHLQAEGGYFAALDYMRRLEQLPWRLFWEGLALEVETYPRNSVSLTLYTLGQRP